jgi:dTDP-4-dehydrorhamnose 3,5-epimerase
MRTLPLKIPGAVLVECELARDGRGSFQTLWESSAVYEDGLRFAPHSAHFSYNARATTLRGMHYQSAPHAQAKLVTCVSGRIWDVVLDLRRGSATFLRWEGVELDPAAARAVFVPPGCAHGYVTLEDDTTVAYLIEGVYVPEAVAVVRWNDPAAAVKWPVSDPILSDGDRSAPDYRP